ncbi:hypothetical protein L204_103325 [Cryptococcus depauperatus]
MSRRIGLSRASSRAHRVSTPTMSEAQESHQQSNLIIRLETPISKVDAIESWMEKTGPVDRSNIRLSVTQDEPPDKALGLWSEPGAEPVKPSPVVENQAVHGYTSVIQETLESIDETEIDGIDWSQSQIQSHSREVAASLANGNERLITQAHEQLSWSDPDTSAYNEENPQPPSELQIQDRDIVSATKPCQDSMPNQTPTVALEKDQSISASHIIATPSVPLAKHIIQSLDPIATISEEHGPLLNFDQELDRTGVDEPPNVPSPDPNPTQPPSRTLRSNKATPTSVITSHPSMSPITKVFSVKSASRKREDQLLSRHKLHTQSPVRQFMSRRQKKTQNPSQEEESFGATDTPAKKVAKDPLAELGAFMQRHAAAMTGKKQDLIARKTRNIEKIQEIKREASQKYKQSESSIEDTTIRWKESLESNRPRASTADYEEGPGSPTPLHGQLVSSQDPDASSLQSGMAEDMDASQVRLIASSSTQDSNLSQFHQNRISSLSPSNLGRSNHFADQTSSITDTYRCDSNGGLFSSQVTTDKSNLLDSREGQSQMSNTFQATQVMPMQSSGSDPTPASAFSATNGMLEPTQVGPLPDAESTPVLAETLDILQPVTRSVDANPKSEFTSKAHSVHPSIPIHRTLAYNSRRNSRSLHPSSTTSVSYGPSEEKRVEIPLHRQLRRRSKDVSEESPQTMSPVAMSVMPAVLETERTLQVQVIQSAPLVTPENIDMRQSVSLKASKIENCRAEENTSGPSLELRPMDLHETTENAFELKNFIGTRPADKDITLDHQSSPHSSSPDPIQSLSSSRRRKRRVLSSKVASSNVGKRKPFAKHGIPEKIVDESVQELHDDLSSTYSPPLVTIPETFKNRTRRKRMLFTSSSSHRLDRSASKVEGGELSNRESSYEPDGIMDKSHHQILKVTQTASPCAKAGFVPYTRKPAKSLSRQATVSVNKRKRHEAIPNDLSELNCSEDSPESDDPEDNTYRPENVKESGKSRGKTKNEPEIILPKRNSREPPRKRNRLLDEPSRTSTPVSVTITSQEDSNRVLASYQQHYYPARIVETTSKGFKVLFYDTDNREVTSDRMRQLILRKGEELEGYQRKDLPNKMFVAASWDGNERGVKCIDEQKKSLGFVELKHIRIRRAVIFQNFRDRLFVRHVELAAPSPVKLTYPSSRPSNLPIFKGIVFLLTGGSEKNSDDRDPEDLEKSIKDHSGVVEKTWERLFDPNSPGGASFAKTLTCTPFVIPTGSKPLLTPKFMIALAKGIPVISAKWIDDSITKRMVVDWQPYLISSGHSTVTQQMMSQRVDLSWGAEGWDKSRAMHISSPLKGKKVLFIVPNSQNTKALVTLVPFCVTALSTEEHKSITGSSKSDVDDMTDQKWDYIVVDDRNMDIPGILVGSPQLANIHWLKQCLIMGDALPPFIR